MAYVFAVLLALIWLRLLLFSFEAFTFELLLHALLLFTLSPSLGLFALYRGLTLCGLLVLELLPDVAATPILQETTRGVQVQVVLFSLVGLA